MPRISLLFWLVFGILIFILAFSIVIIGLMVSYVDGFLEALYSYKKGWLRCVFTNIRECLFDAIKNNVSTLYIVYTPNMDHVFCVSSNLSEHTYFGKRGIGLIIKCKLYDNKLDPVKCFPVWIYGIGNSEVYAKVKSLLEEKGLG